MGHFQRDSVVLVHNMWSFMNSGRLWTVDLSLPHTSSLCYAHTTLHTEHCTWTFALLPCFLYCRTYCVCIVLIVFLCFMFILCSLYAPIHQNKFQVGGNLLGNKYNSDSDYEQRSLMNSGRWWTAVVDEQRSLMNSGRWWTAVVYEQRSLMNSGRLWTAVVYEQRSLMNSGRWWTAVVYSSDSTTFLESWLCARWEDWNYFDVFVPATRKQPGVCVTGVSGKFP